MPTEYQYRTAADDFRQRSHSYRDAAAWAPPDPSGGFTGDGPVADIVDRAFARIRRALGDAAHDLDLIARECDRRATVCGTYRRALQRYRSLPWHIREHTVEPARPARWADR